VKHLPQKQQKWKVNHRIYGDNLLFTSYKELVEKTFDLAQEEAEKMMYESMLDLAEELADDMLETAVEYDA
jgi:hypothetical protein